MSLPERDVHGLTAAYAVDALSGDERERARTHIGECADCRRDLAEFHATTVRLAYAQAERPPEAVWERLRASVPNVRRLPPETEDSRPTAHPGAGPGTYAGTGAAGAREAASGMGGSAGREGAEGTAAAGRGDGEGRVGRADRGNREGAGARVADIADRRRLRQRLPWLMTAACAVIALVLGGTMLVMSQRMQEMNEHTAKVEALLAASDTHMDEQPVTQSGAEATVFTSESSDMVMIMVKGLPPTPDGMGYQMWYVDDSGMRSAGMLERSGDGMYSGMAGDVGPAEQLGISLEPAGGMPEPSGEPMKVEL
ncbi:anti-sigma factor [Streptomonospora wellingtoniae]|uniref:Regulator of SigK n=1 Tax=Streptomonospora wellingtoniae TaxID=3075544 RepID=A0ABU2KUL9_9ACTN|nr:anti-sigma factor [Streptomonospora sp. DSM 45055]MDT0302857.1 anti-sigma factor [Streptomonospora sp. DSM 45055]